MSAMRCACYARFSSDLQRQTSIDDQLAVARRYADQQGWTVLEAHVYTDEGLSGISMDGRAGVQALLAAAETTPRPFDVLLVDDSSRVAGDLPDALHALRHLRFFRVRTLYISQQIDSADEQAETLLTVHGLVDGLYLQEMSKKIKRGLAGQIARGFSVGHRTFGYESVPVPHPDGKLDGDGYAVLLGKRLKIVEAQAQVIRDVFAWYADGLGAGQIAAKLNRAGITGPTRKIWRDSAVRRLLGNERFLGRLIWGQTVHERRPGTRRKVVRAVPREQWHIHEAPELRILPDELWGRVQTRRAEVRRGFKLRDGQPLVRGKNAALYSKHLFSGLLRCGVCEGAITAVAGGCGKPRYGCSRAWRSGRARCSNRITIQACVVDQILLERLRAELQRPEMVAHLAAAVTAEINRLIDMRPKRREELAALRGDRHRKLAHLVEAVEAGGGATALYQAIQQRESELTAIDDEIAALETPLDEKLAVIPTWIKKQLDDIVGLLQKSPERTKVEFRRLGVRFTLHPQESGGRRFLRAVGEGRLPHLHFSPVLSSSASDRLGGRAGAERSWWLARYTGSADGPTGASAPSTARL